VGRWVNRSIDRSIGLASFAGFFLTHISQRGGRVVRCRRQPVAPVRSEALVPLADFPRQTGSRAAHEQSGRKNERKTMGRVCSESVNQSHQSVREWCVGTLMDLP
jgi:hypothetical protein